MKKFLLLASLAASAAFAGDKAGNGGNVVLCRSSDGKVSSVKMLDHYEAETIWGFKLDLGDASLSPQAKVKLALERARRFHPLTADELEARAEGFFDDALLLSNVELTPVDDSGEYFLPVGCQLKQIAVQRVKEFPQDKTFLVNKDVWDILDNDGKAGLILHEIAYEKLLHAKPPFTPLPGDAPLVPESRMARFFNALVSSAGYEQLTFDQYLPLLQDLWFLQDFSVGGTVLTGVLASQRYGVRGNLPKVSPAVLDFAGAKVSMVPGSQVTWRAGRFVLASPANSLTVTVRGVSYPTRAGRMVQLFDTGDPEGFYLDAPASLTWQGHELPLRANTELEFHSDGSPLDLHLDVPYAWQPGGHEVWTGKNGEASFQDDDSLHRLECISHDHPFTLVDTRGRTLTCAAGQTQCTYDQGGGSTAWPDSISLDPSGRMISAQADDPKNTYCSR